MSDRRRWGPLLFEETGGLSHSRSAPRLTLFITGISPFQLLSLQAPMFGPNADSAVNYGAFGAYAAHEITHGLDNQGRKIDAKGGLRDWWTGDEIKTFEARAAELGKPHAWPRGRHIRNPVSGGYCARLGRAQGPHGCPLCCHRPTDTHQPGSHQHRGAGGTAADDARNA